MMSRTSIFVILGACLVAGLLIAGCTSTQPQAAVQTTATPAPATPSAAATPAAVTTEGMANPASVNCVSLNGTIDIKKNADGGEYGMCTFTNGTSCEEWALFRGEGCTSGVSNAPVANVTAPNTTAPKDVPAGSAGMANPASVNCGKVGATSEIKTASDGSQYGMCTFTNGTSCEEWALFRGEGCKAYVPTAATNASK
ncbi:MAG: DUF333 domain-containing protein [Methanoregula sp.]